MNKKKFIEKDEHITFEEVSWPKKVKTNYLVSGCGKDGQAKEYYTLECLVYFLKNVDLPHAVYAKQAAVKNIQALQQPDRKDLLAYLNGETTTSVQIDESAPLKRVTDDLLNEANKKPRLEKTDVKSVKEHLTAPKKSSVKTEQIHSPIDTASVEKTSAITDEVPDPLKLLRQYHASKMRIIEKDGYVQFGKYLWPKDTPTSFTCWGTMKGSKPKEYYTLECLLFLLRNVNLPHPQYVGQAKDLNIPIIRRPDRKEILAYLNEEIATSSSIDHDAVSVSPKLQVETDLV